VSRQSSLQPPRLSRLLPLYPKHLHTLLGLAITRMGDDGCGMVTVSMSGPGTRTDRVILQALFSFLDLFSLSDILCYH
jgi:hypothetical protein